MPNPVREHSHALSEQLLESEEDEDVRSYSHPPSQHSSTQSVTEYSWLSDRSFKWEPVLSLSDPSNDPDAIIDEPETLTDTSSVSPLSPINANATSAAVSSLSLCRLPFKPVLLFFLCLLRFGPYFAYDLPGALFDEIEAWFAPKSYTSTSNAWLYGAYSWPNIALPFASGIFIERWLGHRWSPLFFATFVVIGQLILTLGIYRQMFGMALAGSFVFGIGGESLTIAQNTLVVEWFDGNSLALAFGLILAFSRLGTSATFLVSPVIADDVGMGWVLSLTFILCVVSWVACAVVALCDRLGKRTVENDRQLNSNPTMNASLSVNSQENSPHVLPHALTLNDVRHLGSGTWLMILAIAFTSVSASTFQSVAQDVFTHTGSNLSADAADRYISIIAFIAIIASPTFGAIIDRHGRALLWLQLSCILMILAHLYVLMLVYEFEPFVSIGPVPVVVGIGLGFSIASTVSWSSLPHCIDSRRASLAFGMATSIQNLGLSTAPEIISGFRSICMSPRSEFVVIALFFFFISSAALLVTFFLMAHDSRDNRGKLNRSGAQKRKLLERRRSLLTASSDDASLHHSAVGASNTSINSAGRDESMH